MVVLLIQYNTVNYFYQTIISDVQKLLKMSLYRRSHSKPSQSYFLNESSPSDTTILTLKVYICCSYVLAAGERESKTLTNLHRLDLALPIEIIGLESYVTLPKTPKYHSAF